MDLKSKVKAKNIKVSIFVLLVVHISRGEDVFFAIGGMIWEVAIGLVVGGLVLFNILLFFYNILRPDNNLKFDIIDKFIAGIWFIIILKIFNLR